MGFPTTRMRRLRRTSGIRRLVRETRLSSDSLVLPIFVDESATERTPIPSMPGQFRWPLSELQMLAREVRRSGIRAVLLFGLPARKDEVGSEAFNPDGIVQVATRELKDVSPDLTVITDTCLDEYTSHGHCGLIKDGQVDNDSTLEILARTAVAQADAGAEIVAPSDMMDGRVAAIREALDQAGHEQTLIMAY
ncbi:MAG: porphobilinogen synthase, partial [Chloroflexota bacterium]